MHLLIGYISKIILLTRYINDNQLETINIDFEKFSNLYKL